MMPSILRLDEVLRVPTPAERAGIVDVVVLDVPLNRRDALVKRVEDRILQPLPGQLREEPLDGINTGR